MKLASFVVASLVLTLSDTARAERIADPTTDFSLEFEPHADSLCVIAPPAHMDAGACGALQASQVEKAFEGLPEKPLFAAIAKMGSWGFAVTVTRQAPLDVPEKDLDAFRRGILRSAAFRELELVQPVPPARRTLVNGVTIAEVSAGGTTPDGSEQWGALYALCGEAANYVLYTRTDTAEHAQQVEAIMQSSLATLQLRPPARRDADVEKAARTGDMIGYALEAIAGVVFVVFLIWFAIKNRQPRPTTQPTRAKPRVKKRKRNVVSWDRDRDGP